MLLPVIENALTCHASEGEHANLGGDVVPRAWRPQLLQSLLQALPHFLDAATHGTDAPLPVRITKVVCHQSSSSTYVLHKDVLIKEGTTAPQAIGESGK